MSDGWLVLSPWRDRSDGAGWRRWGSLRGKVAHGGFFQFPAAEQKGVSRRLMTFWTCGGPFPGRRLRRGHGPWCIDYKATGRWGFAGSSGTPARNAASLLPTSATRASSTFQATMALAAYPDFWCLRVAPKRRMTPRRHRFLQRVEEHLLRYPEVLGDFDDRAVPNGDIALNRGDYFFFQFCQHGAI